MHPLHVRDDEAAARDGRHARHVEAEIVSRHGVAHEKPATVLEIYQPAGRMEQFFREVGRFTDPPLHEALSIAEMKALFDAHGMRLLGPGLSWSEGPADTPLVGESPVGHSPPAVLDDYVGEYALSPDGRAIVTRQGEQLRIEIPGVIIRRASPSGRTSSF